MPPLISVIIPFYNRRALLESTLKCLADQTFESLEYILVDDGSTDGSFELCKSFALSDDRFRLLRSKENRGVSVARNFGIEAARGDYIAFMDSDDYIDRDYFEILYGHMLLNDTHLQICPLDQGGVAATLPEGVFSLDPQKLVALIRAGLFFSACGKLFRADTVRNNGLFFSENLSFGEDLIFCLSYYPFCEKFAFNSSPLYVYNRNISNESLSQRLRFDIYRHEKFLQEKIRAFAKDHSLYGEELEDLLKARLFDCAYNALCLTASWPRFELSEKYIYIKEILSDRELWPNPDPALAYSPLLVGAIFKGRSIFLAVYINIFARIKRKLSKEKVK